MGRHARVWDAASGKQLALLQGPTALVQGACFSPDGARVAAGSWNGTARVWDAASGKPLALLEGHSPTFSPDGTRLATAFADRSARVWDAASGKQLALLQGHTGWVLSVSFSPDGARLATASADGTARVWDAASGKQLVLLQGHTSDVRRVCFSPDGARLATASQDGTVRVWIAQETEAQLQERRRCAREQQAEDAESTRNSFAAAFLLGQLIREQPHNADLYRRRAIAYLEQGQWAEALATSDQGLAVHSGAAPRPQSLPAPRLLAKDLRRHRRRLFPRRQAGASGGEDRILRRWDLENGKELRQLPGHANWIWSVALCPTARPLFPAARTIPHASGTWNRARNSAPRHGRHRLVRALLSGRPPGGGDLLGHQDPFPGWKDGLSSITSSPVPWRRSTSLSRPTANGSSWAMSRGRRSSAKPRPGRCSARSAATGTGSTA